MEWFRDGYLLTDVTARFDFDAVHRLLADTYWAADRPRKVSEKAFQHSICFGLFHDGAQVGFARAVSDFATFTYICDVVVAPKHRRRGLGRWMMETMLGHPLLRTQSYALRTEDAHEFYERLGFERTEYMRRSRHPA